CACARAPGGPNDKGPGGPLKGGLEMRSKTWRPAALRGVAWCLMLVGLLAWVAVPLAAEETAAEETAAGTTVTAGTATEETPAAVAEAQEGGGAGPTMEISGFIMLDTGYQSGQNDPNWFDVLRPTKLPAFKNQFGEDGRWFASVRQTRFGVKANLPTSLGEVKTTFEFELFGTGVDAGQTTFR